MNVLLGAALAGLALLVGCGGSSSNNATPQPLDWTSCDDVANTQCASIEVPVDHSRANGAKFALRLARVPAVDQAKKLGMLLLIPGGPGVGISDTFGATRELGHIDDFSQLFDVVSFDPRGVGESSPIRCSPGAVPSPIAPFDRAPTSDEFNAIADANAAFVKTCFDTTGELMRHLSSKDTADDIESIRLALTPNRRLVAYGASYGTIYGATYLERHSDHLRTLVIDGIADHSVQMPTDLTTHIVSTQDAFDRFKQWCDHNASCAVHGQDVGAVFDADIAKIPSVRWVVPLFFALGQTGWPDIAKMLAQPSAGPTPGDLSGKTGLFLGVVCSDNGPQSDYAALVSTYSAVVLSSPRFAWKFWDATPQIHGTVGVGDCVGWPFDAANPPHRLQVGPHPNVLVANDTHDSSTPLVNALSVWQQIPRARLLIADVDGHQSLFWSQCAYQAIRSFLVDTTSLEEKTLCPN